MRGKLSVVGLGLMVAGGVQAADQDAVPQLEEVTVTAALINGNGSSLGGTSISREEMLLFNRDTLDNAIQLAPGASVSTVGARNETDVWIRGFDRWRVPLYQDGIPVYLPVDDRIDFSRFSTVDISQIQVSKGWASVIDGPGAMGGSINLVSRIAEKPLELDARAGEQFDSRRLTGGHHHRLLRRHAPEPVVRAGLRFVGPPDAFPAVG